MATKVEAIHILVRALGATSSEYSDEVTIDNDTITMHIDTSPITLPGDDSPAT